MGYQPKVYRKQGGDELVVAASGIVDAESGGTIKLRSGSSLDLHQGASVKDSSVGVSAERISFTEKVALTAATATGGAKVFSWQAPTGTAIIVTRLVLDITTQAATAGCTLDAGTATTNATTKSDNLIDGLVATGTAAVGAKDNITDKGTNGKSRQKLAAGKWVTASAVVAKGTSLAGSAYITYITA